MELMIDATSPKIMIKAKTKIRKTIDKICLSADGIKSINHHSLSSSNIPKNPRIIKNTIVDEQEILNNAHTMLIPIILANPSINLPFSSVRFRH
jgi:hypothetical protein